MATVQVIRKNKRNPWDEALGIVGQGIQGYASGAMGKQRMDMMNDNNDRMQKLMERMWGANGSGINPPAAMSPQFGAAVDAVNTGVGIPAQTQFGLNPTEDDMDIMNGLFSRWR